MDPDLGFDFIASIFDFYEFSLRLCARNPTMASELLAKCFNSVMCLIYISIFVICHVFMRIHVFIYVYVYILNIWYSCELYNHMMIIWFVYILIYTWFMFVFVIGNHIRYEFWIRWCRFGEIWLRCPFFVNEYPFLTGNERLNKTDG